MAKMASGLPPVLPNWDTLGSLGVQQYSNQTLGTDFCDFDDLVGTKQPCRMDTTTGTFWPAMLADIYPIRDTFTHHACFISEPIWGAASLGPGSSCKASLLGGDAFEDCNRHF